MAESAKVAGDLEYSSTYDLTFPGSSVGGEVTRVEPEFDENTYVPPTPAEKTVKWALDLLRTIVTLVLFGLLLGWLAPAFLNATSGKIKTQTWPSLGWGAIAWAAFFFALLLIVIVMIAGGIIFGVLTLGGLSGTIIWLGILSMFALTVAFRAGNRLRDQDRGRYGAWQMDLQQDQSRPGRTQILADDPGRDRHRSCGCTVPLPACAAGLLRLADQLRRSTLWPGRALAVGP